MHLRRRHLYNRDRQDKLYSPHISVQFITPQKGKTKIQRVQLDIFKTEPIKGSTELRQSYHFIPHVSKKFCVKKLPDQKHRHRRLGEELEVKRKLYERKLLARSASPALHRRSKMNLPLRMQANGNS